MKILLVLLPLLLRLSCSQYKVDSASQNASGVSLALSYIGNSSFYIKPTSPIIQRLQFVLKCHTRSDISFKIINADSDRFEIPQGGLFPLDPAANYSFPILNSDVTFNYTANPFSFRILRQQNQQILFDSSAGNIVYSEYYLEISTVVPRVVYGLGQRWSPSLRLGTGKYTIFNRDRPGQPDYGNGYNTYGAYPLYLTRDTQDNFHITLLRNSNAMDVVISNHTNSTFLFTYKLIGGVIDFRLFVGEKDPEAVIKRFHEYSGPSMVPPFWAMGFHQSRWGYRNAHELETVLKGYEDNGIPLDTIWSDIDYMHAREDFTIDQERFPLENMTRITNRYNYVPIIDAGVKISGDAHAEGLKRNVFIKDAQGGNLVGEVWPGPTNFVDFFHPNASSYWGDMLDTLYRKVKFAGVWLDMNEVSNFCDGACIKQNKTGFDFNRDLPYMPGADDIESHTISMNATHFGGYKEADVHTYFGLLECAATFKFLKNKGLRPFILTRSSTVGSGRYTAHWTGDNEAHFDFLKFSISHNFMFQIWGIQMVGADICGFTGNTTVQLCSRWFQLGAFYPFSRNHNFILSEAQEAYALGPQVKEAARVNLKLRYALLKHYYMQFVNNKGIGSIFRPLFFQFPLDAVSYNNTTVSETQFLLGKELMFAPIVDKGEISRSVYCPSGSNWWNFHLGNSSQGGAFTQITCQVTDLIILLLREGYGVLYQNTTNVTRVEQLDNKFVLKSALGLNSSTDAYRTYTSVSSLLSIKNFSNESQVSACIEEGCAYQLTSTLNVTASSRSLSIQVAYVGNAVLMQEVFITRLQLFYDANKKIDTIPEQPISVWCRLCTINVPIPPSRVLRVQQQ